MLLPSSSVTGSVAFTAEQLAEASQLLFLLSGYDPVLPTSLDESIHAAVDVVISVGC